MQQRTRVNVVASGRVQGVFFRDATREQARSLGVSGWARNRRDGTVEAEFEGSPSAVEQMLDFVRAGPGHAVVDAVEVSEVDVVEDAGFIIR